MRFHTEIIREDGTTFTDGVSSSLEYELRRRDDILTSNRNNDEYQARVMSDDGKWGKIYTDRDLRKGFDR